MSAMDDPIDHPPKVCVLFPTKNESQTIKCCIETAKNSKYKPTIIVADGNSTDETRKIASENGAEVVITKKRIHPGKGAALKTGIQKSLEQNPDIIVFLDADIQNLTTEWIDKLIDSIDRDRYDMARGYYVRAPRDAGVTKLVARPLLHVFFPEISHFEQPLSGEVAAKTEVWKNLINGETPDGWGIDVWFLIEAAMHAYKIREVFLGTKDHKSFQSYEDDVAKLAKMAEQVAITIVSEAIKYQRIDNCEMNYA